MDEKQQQKLVNRSVEIVDNLRQALKDAGGAGFSLSKLEQMTVMDLVRIMALNDVYCNFSYIGNAKNEINHNTQIFYGVRPLENKDYATIRDMIINEINKANKTNKRIK